MVNYFAFTDESGNSSQERFFGLGMLMIKCASNLYDSIKYLYERIYSNAKFIKNSRINDLIKNGNYEELKSLCSSSKHFELKFKNINFSNNLFYKTIIDEYFNFNDNMFFCLIKDRKEMDATEKFDPWESYIEDAAILLANNIKTVPYSEVCVLCDDLSKPSTVDDTFENRLSVKVRKKLDELEERDNLFGITRIESHASLLVQLVDVLLGCVMFDFKLEAGIISKKQFDRKNIVVEQCRKRIRKNRLSKSFAVEKPNYFSVWEYLKK